MRGSRDRLSGPVLRGLEARVALGDTGPELRRARSHAMRGDSAWKALLDHYESGDALIVELRAVAMVEDAGIVRPLCYSHQAVWLERPTTWQRVEAHLRVITRRDFRIVCPELRNRGIALELSEPELPTNVVVDRDVAARIAEACASRPTREERPRRFRLVPRERAVALPHAHGMTPSADEDVIASPPRVAPAREQRFVMDWSL